MRIWLVPDPRRNLIDEPEIWLVLFGSQPDINLYPVWQDVQQAGYFSSVLLVQAFVGYVF